jgi:Spy/CpxP family protein refolding chaperone
MLNLTSIFVALLATALALSSAAQEPRRAKQPYSIQQAISDNAQLHTISFNGLAFISGDFGPSTFIPPGKVCDYFGFQYMRDIDTQQKGHNPLFINRVTAAVLATLSPEQRQLFAALAEKQSPDLTRLAEMRLPIIKSFHMLRDGQLPPGSTGLNEPSLAAAFADIFELDARLSLERAQTYQQVVASLTPTQVAALSTMKFGDFSTWPDLDPQPYRMPRGTPKMTSVAYTTYASEFFSWYAGSVEADTYFCPERHGTYFGGFYMKDIPAMGKRDYDISTAITGDSGKSFLDLLTPDQRRLMTTIPNAQREALAEIVTTRGTISTELRKLLQSQQPDEKLLLSLGRRYGELDAHLSYLYVTAFAKVAATLTPAQRAQIDKLRNLTGYTPAPAYIYSSPLKDLPDLSSASAFFFPPAAR